MRVTEDVCDVPDGIFGLLVRCRGDNSLAQNDDRFLVMLLSQLGLVNPLVVVSFDL